MVKAIKHFHPYLYGRTFTLRTDHAALQWLLSFKFPEGQIARWIERLQQYDFRIKHRPGVLHGNADTLSRRPCVQDSCKHCDHLDTKETHLQQTEVGVNLVSLRKPLQVAATRLDRVTDAIEGLPHTNGSLQQAQEFDPDIGPVLNWLRTDGVRPSWEVVAPYSEDTKLYWAQWDSLCVQDGVLYRAWETPKGDQKILQLLLPRKLRPQVLHDLHNTPTGGHLGIAKTLGRVRERFYWSKCRRDVEDWCKSCDLCASRKGPSKKVRAPMAQYNVGAPMERLAVDVMGPLPETDSGNKYLLIAMDYFSKWPEAYPLPDQEAYSVAEVLVRELVSRFGVPLSIHSDQGRNFESTLFQEMCKLLGIEKTRTTPLHPQSDGMVERFNRTLEAQLSKFVEENQRNWDVLVPLMMMAYRSAVHDSTGYTPARLTFGRDLRLPIDLAYGHPAEEPPPHKTAYVLQLQERLESVHLYARQHIRIKSDKMKLHYDAHHHEEAQLQEGTPVWLYNPQRKRGRSPKLQRNWQGPYVVIKKINDLVYRVRMGPYTRPKVVHRNRLWTYHGANTPTWFRPAKDCPPSQPIQSENIPVNHESQTAPEITEFDSETSSSIADPPHLRRSDRSRRPPNRYGS